MPTLKVEYAKSSRSRCVNKDCSQFIQKGELRVGTGSTMPGASEMSFKWRHVCCFTKRQLASVGTVDELGGYDEMLPADQLKLQKMVRGELVGKTELRGKISIESDSPKKVAKKGGAGKKRPRSDDDDGGDTSDAGGDSDATDGGYSAPKERPMCPYGATCFRKNPDHFKEFRHGDERDEKYAPKPEAKASPRKAPVDDKEEEAPPAAATKRAADGRPLCPHGKMCFRTAAVHLTTFAHE